MHIILVRHGQSVANTQDILGDPIDSPLTDLGRKQAAAAGKFLKKHYNIKKIYYSPLTRTVQTANLINKSLKVPMEEEYDIREGEWGAEMTNLPIDKMETVTNGKKIKEVFDKATNFAFIETTKINGNPIYRSLLDKWFKLTGSEPYDSIYRRCRKVFTKLKKVHSHGGDILLVSHGGYISCFIRELFNISIEGMGSNLGKYSNCNISSIYVDGTKKHLEVMLYSKYLDDMIKD